MFLIKVYGYSLSLPASQPDGQVTACIWLMISILRVLPGQDNLPFIHT